MHEEDNRNGLLVTIGRGRTKWIAYGDGDFFSMKNKDNLEKTMVALHDSRQQVYKSYTNGRQDKSKGISDQDPRVNQVLSDRFLEKIFMHMPRVPQPGDPVFDDAVLRNTCPRYRVDNGKLMIR